MSSSTTPSSTATPPNQNTTTPDQQETTPSSSSNHQPLPLPEPPAAGQDGDGSSAARQLEVGGEGLKLDHLGPLVVHQDGTMSRIGNWGEMSDFERENTLRIIGKRNQQRLKKLREEGGTLPASRLRRPPPTKTSPGSSSSPKAEKRNGKQGRG
ncbi:hypothetical protein PG990_003791 [Apiospora arundinis]